MSDANVPTQAATSPDHTAPLTPESTPIPVAAEPPPTSEPPPPTSEPPPPTSEPSPPTSEPPPPPPPPSQPPTSQPSSETPTSTSTTRETSRTRSRTSTQQPTSVQTSAANPSSPPPDTLQLPAATDISVPLTSTPTASTVPIQSTTAFPAVEQPNADPSSISALAMVAIIFAVVAVVGLFAGFVSLVTRRAKRRREYSTPRTSPPAPMTFKRDPSPFRPTLIPKPSTELSFRPSQKHHHPPPYLPNFAANLRPQLIPPAATSSYPTTTTGSGFLHPTPTTSSGLLHPTPTTSSGILHHPTQYLPIGPVVAPNGFEQHTTNVPPAAWYGNRSRGLTLPPNSPYEDYLALYNGDGALADAAYYSDYSAAAAKVGENPSPRNRLGESLFYQPREVRNLPETDPYHVSSKPVQGYDKPPNSMPGFPPIGGLSITNGYSSDVNSEDSDSSTGRYGRLNSSRPAVGDTANGSNLRNSPLNSSEQVGQMPRSEGSDSSTGRYHAVGDTAARSDMRDYPLNTAENVGPVARSGNARVASSTDSQKLELPHGRESPRKGPAKTFALDEENDQVDENTTGMETKHNSSFFFQRPSSKFETSEPKVGQSDVVSDGSAFDSSEDDGPGPGGKGYYGRSKYVGRF